MKKFLSNTLLFLLFLAPAIDVQADSHLIINGEGTATISWSAPTEYSDGSTLPVGDIDGFVIFYNDQSRFNADGTTLRPGCTAGPEASRTDPACYATAVDVAIGDTVSQQLTFQLGEDVTLYYAMTSYVRGGGAFGSWSLYSAEVTKSFTLAVNDMRPPGAPTILTIDMVITCTTDQAQVTCSFTVQ